MLRLRLHNASTDSDQSYHYPCEIFHPRTNSQLEDSAVTTDAEPAPAPGPEQQDPLFSCTGAPISDFPSLRHASFFFSLFSL